MAVAQRAIFVTANAQFFEARQRKYPDEDLTGKKGNLRSPKGGGGQGIE